MIYHVAHTTVADFLKEPQVITYTALLFLGKLVENRKETYEFKS